MENFNLTEKEKEFIIAFGKSDYYDGADLKLWDFSVHENLSFKGKTRSAIVSSLVKKGIIEIADKKEYGINNPFNCYGISIEFQKNDTILHLLNLKTI